MANTFKFGNGNWAVKDGYALAYNDENNNFKPLPFDFTRASSATRVNKQGLIETVGSGKPRIDFTDNTSGHLLLEPSRSNLVTYSEDLTGGSKNVVTATANTTETLDPSGNNNATKFQVTASGADAYSRTQYTAALTNFSCFIYVKAAADQKFQIFAARDGYAQIVNGDLITCTGDWQKVEFSGTFDTTSSTVVLGIEFGHSATDSVSGQVYYCWGAQLEAGSLTSYIPTEGSSVTRVAESCSQTPSDGVIGQTEGVLYAEINTQQSTYSNWFQIVDSSYSNWIFIGVSGNKLVGYIKCNGSVIIHSQDFVLQNKVDYKLALAYKSGNSSFYINGSEIFNISNTFTISNLFSKLIIGDNSPSELVQYKQAQLYNTRLSNAELQALTT